MNVIKKVLKVFYRFLKKVFAKIFLLKIFKINNRKIVFDNFLGKGYGCNPKYIAEEIIKEKLDYDMVWLVKDKKEDIPKKIRKVKYGSIRALYELATAKVWIDNVRNSKGINKKKEQFYIQTWHGAIGLKAVEKEVEDTLSMEYVKEAKYDGSITNLLITNNKDQEEYMKKNFWYSGEIAYIGTPRNDIIYQTTSDIKDKVYQYFKIPTYKKIVLYAPTFRKETDMEVYKFNYMKCCEVLRDKFGQEFVMLIRLHPNISNYSNEFKYNASIINATSYPDMQELLASASIIITDYSSVSFEVGLVKKPVFLLAKDLKEYTENDRKLLYHFDEIPFLIAESENELYKNIEEFSKEEYDNRVEQFHKKIGLIHNSNSAKDIVNRIKKETQYR